MFHVGEITRIHGCEAAPALPGSASSRDESLGAMRSDRSVDRPRLTPTLANPGQGNESVEASVPFSPFWQFREYPSYSPCPADGVSQRVWPPCAVGFSS